MPPAWASTAVQDIPLDSVDLKLQFDNLDIPVPAPGITVYVFQNPANLQIAPKLEVHGLGIQFAGPGGNPLIKNSSFRLESVGANVFFDFDGSISNLGGAIDAKGLGCR